MKRQKCLFGAHFAIRRLNQTKNTHRVFSANQINVFSMYRLSVCGVVSAEILGTHAI